MGEAVAFLGLGVMGFPMAGHLQRAGHATTVYNRTGSTAERWLGAYGGRRADTPAAAAADARFVFACVGDDPDVEAVLLGPDGALAAMTAGSVLVDHTTASPGLARRLHGAARERGVAFLDAPVSGGEAGAVNGALTVMVGGEEADCERVRPLLDAYAKNVAWIGPAGSGQLCKMVNQICIAGVVQGLAEGLHFGRRAGLDLERVVAAIGQGAAQSWQMENRHRTMAEGAYEHGFAVDWMRKDLRIALGEARANGARLPLTALVDQLYAEVQAMGGGRWDTSSLLARLEREG